MLTAQIGIFLCQYLKIKEWKFLFLSVANNQHESDADGSILVGLSSWKPPAEMWWPTGPIIGGSFTQFMIYIFPPTDGETESKIPERERRTTCPLRDVKQRDLPSTLKVIHNLFHWRIYIFQSSWVKCGRVIWKCCLLLSGFPYP